MSAVEVRENLVPPRRREPGLATHLSPEGVRQVDLETDHAGRIVSVRMVQGPPPLGRHPSGTTVRAGLRPELRLAQSERDQNSRGYRKTQAARLQSGRTQRRNAPLDGSRLRAILPDSRFLVRVRAGLRARRCDIRPWTTGANQPVRAASLQNGNVANLAVISAAIGLEQIGQVGGAITPSPSGRLSWRALVVEEDASSFDSDFDAPSDFSPLDFADVPSDAFSSATLSAELMVG